MHMVVLASSCPLLQTQTLFFFKIKVECEKLWVAKLRTYLIHFLDELHVLNSTSSQMKFIFILFCESLVNNCSPWVLLKDPFNNNQR